MLGLTPGSHSDTFGYISHSTINVGDDFQSIAARQFLPEHAVAVDREFIAEFAHRSRVRVVVSGWFMHQAGSYWDLSIAPPQRSWPPACAIDPLFISLHLTQTFHETVFASGNLDYLQRHAPIGARDFYTLDALQRHDVPSYFSGCLTLALPGKTTPRRDVIYAVDVDDAALAHITAQTETPVHVLTHGKPILQLLRPEHRLQHADYILALPKRQMRCDDQTARGPSVSRLRDASADDLLPNEGLAQPALRRFDRTSAARISGGVDKRRS